MSEQWELHEWHSRSHRVDDDPTICAKCRFCEEVYVAVEEDGVTRRCYWCKYEESATNWVTGAPCAGGGAWCSERNTKGRCAYYEPKATLKASA